MTDSADELLMVLRLQRDIMQLSAQNRRTLLSFLQEDGGAQSKDAETNTQASSERKPSKKLVLRESKARKIRRSGRKAKAEGLPAMVVAIVEAAPQRIGAAEVLEAVRESRPDVKPVGVYQALHAAAAEEKIGKDMSSNKAVYFKLGAKKK